MFARKRGKARARPSTLSRTALNLAVMARYRITMRGFIVRDHFDMLPGYLADMAQWLQEGRIKYVEDVTQGLENAPAAFIGMLKGENFGKQVVQISEDPTKP